MKKKSLITFLISSILLVGCNGEKSGQVKYTWHYDEDGHYQLCDDPNCYLKHNAGEHSFEEYYEGGKGYNRCTQCGYTTHIHSYDQFTYQSDNEYHWRVCKEPGCGLVMEKEKHTVIYKVLDGGKVSEECSVCGKVFGEKSNFNLKDAFDFVVEIDKNVEDIKILQLTDTQNIDKSQERNVNDTSIKPGPLSEKTIQENEAYSFSYMRRLINQNNPDLIIFTGDIIYGRFDDNGLNVLQMIEFMDSFKIPWAPIFGNHDNESRKGVAWQCEQYANGEYCLFNRGNVSGNGNYTIGVFAKDELAKVIYMMDSNGCDQAYHDPYTPGFPDFNFSETVITSAGIYEDQVEFVDNTSKLIDLLNGKKSSKFMAFHIAPDFLVSQCTKNGYQESDSDMFEIGVTCQPVNGDFGVKKESIKGCPTGNLLSVMKDNNFNGLFLGHDHINNFSVLCDDFLRVTYGVKSGIFDYHDNSMIGGLLISLEDMEGNFSLEYKYLSVN